MCSFVYGTKWEFNRHLKNKHGLKLVENEGDPKWEVTFESTVLILTFPDARDRMEQAWVLLRGWGFLVGKLGSLFKSRLLPEG